MVHTRAHRAAVYTTRDETTGCTTEAPLGPRHAHHIQGTLYATRTPAPHYCIQGIAKVRCKGPDGAQVGAPCNCSYGPPGNGPPGPQAGPPVAGPASQHGATRWAHHTAVVKGLKGNPTIKEPPGRASGSPTPQIRSRFQDLSQWRCEPAALAREGWPGRPPSTGPPGYAIMMPRYANGSATLL